MYADSKVNSPFRIFDSPFFLWFWFHFSSIHVDSWWDPGSLHGQSCTMFVHSSQSSSTDDPARSLPATTEMEIEDKVGEVCCVQVCCRECQRSRSQRFRGRFRNRWHFIALRPKVVISNTFCRAKSQGFCVACRHMKVARCRATDLKGTCSSFQVGIQGDFPVSWIAQPVWRVCAHPPKLYLEVRG